MVDGYPAIEDHAVIGDLHTVALVATDGTIDWCCLPRFDSPAVFGSILDAHRGGSFSVQCEAKRTKQLYMPDSNVLVTRFLGTDSVGEVIDFMVPHDRTFRPTDTSHLLVRRLRGPWGRGVQCQVQPGLRLCSGGSHGAFARQRRSGVQDAGSRDGPA